MNHDAVTLRKLATILLIFFLFEKRGADPKHNNHNLGWGGLSYCNIILKLGEGIYKGFFPGMTEQN